DEKRGREEGKKRPDVEHLGKMDRGDMVGLISYKLVRIQWFTNVEVKRDKPSTTQKLKEKKVAKRIMMVI
ncbi:hypothetical protein OFB79_26640, partial [Escherichia coli]|nr:hypothetical protein [Escherichia coli]